MSPVQCRQCGDLVVHVCRGGHEEDQCQGCQRAVATCTCPASPDLPAPEHEPIPLQPRRSGHPWETPDDLPF